MRALLLVMISSTAFADPAFTVGVGAGITQGSAEYDQHDNSDGALSVFGRIAGKRFGFELAVAKVDTPRGGGARTFTGLAVLDLGHSDRWVPHVFAGLGLDRPTADTNNYDGHHVEAGAGLELRLVNGFVVGARFHLGYRWTDDADYAMAELCNSEGCTSYPSYTAPLQDGQFRTLDAYAALRF